MYKETTEVEYVEVLHSASEMTYEDLQSVPMSFRPVSNQVTTMCLSRINNVTRLRGFCDICILLWL